MSVLKTPDPLPPPTPENLQRLVESWLPQFYKYVETVVNISSGSREEEGLSQCADELVKIAREVLGTEPIVQELKSEDGLTRKYLDFRVVSESERPTAEEEAKNARFIDHILHYDTVYNKQLPFKFSMDDKYLYGPGVYDNKGAIIGTLFAMRLLQLYGNKDTNRWVRAHAFPEEEIGGFGTRQVIAEISPSTHAFIGQEGLDITESGSYIKVGRRGVTRYAISYTNDPFATKTPELTQPENSTRYVIRFAGSAAHAGTEISRGADANNQTVIDVSRIAAIESSFSGLKVIFEAIKGGKGYNIVSDESQLMFTVESASKADLDQFHTLMERMNPTVEGVTRTLEHRPLEKPAQDSIRRQMTSNAIRQAAIDAEWLKMLQHIPSDVTVNIGLIASNPKPEVLAEISFEARANSLRHFHMLESTVHGLGLQVPGIKRSSSDPMALPPWSEGANTERMYELFRNIHEGFKFPRLEARTSMGGSDINRVPADKLRIDGIAIGGNGDHSTKERALKADAAPSIIRTAVASAELLGQQFVQGLKISSDPHLSISLDSSASSASAASA